MNYRRGGTTHAAIRIPARVYQVGGAVLVGIVGREGGGMLNGRSHTRVFQTINKLVPINRVTNGGVRW
jgi:hypothetical protein